MDADAAWQAAERVCEFPHQYVTLHNYEGKSTAIACETDRHVATIVAPTPSRALCLAILYLKLKEVE